MATFTKTQTANNVTTNVWNSEIDSSINNRVLTISTKDKYLDRDIKLTLKGSSTGTAAVIASEGSVTTNPTVKTTISAPTTGYGFTTTKPSGTVGTNYVALTSSTDGVSSNGSVQTKYKVTTAGYTPTKSATNSGTVSITGVTNGTGVSYYQPIVTPTFAGGAVTATSAYASGQSANVEVEDTDHSGVKVGFSANASRTAVTYSNTAGAIAAHTNTSASAAANATTANASKWIKGFTLNKGKVMEMTNAVTEKVTMKYNSDTNSVDFIFA